MNDSPMQFSLNLLAAGKHLPRDVAERAFQIIMNGGATPAQMAAFLMGLRINGETIDEITAGATVLRAKMKTINAPAGTIDTCGTGGDSRGTYNISTATAFVMAACGVPVAKHGNRSVSSKSGSADVLEALGINVAMEPEQAERCLHECGITFLMAPKFHSAMRHVAPIRQELGLRTIFNMLGPLSNPAKPHFQLLGVYSKDLLEPFAHVLQQLGVEAAWVVHGHDGLDELTLTGTSFVAELKNGSIRTFEVTPAEAGLPSAMLEDLKGGDASVNAEAMRTALSGIENPYRNAVVYNAAAGLVIAGKAADLKQGATLAAAAIDNGEAFKVLQKLVLISHE